MSISAPSRTSVGRAGSQRPKRTRSLLCIPEPAQQVGQGDRAPDRGAGLGLHGRGSGVAHLEPHGGQPLLLRLDRLLFGAVDLPAAVVDEPQFPAQRCEAPVGIVAAQHQAVFAAAGEHPVGLAQILGDQVVDQGADVAALAGEVHRGLAPHQAGGVESRHQALGGGLLVAGGAVELAGAEQAGDPFGFQRGLELGGGQVVVVHGVGRPQHDALLQPRQGAQQLQLQPFRQAGGEALHVQLGGVAAFRFQEDLVAVLVGEAHDLVFDRGAVAGPLAVDEAAVDRREVEIVSDQLVGGGGGAGDVAGHLLAACPGAGIEGEEAVGGIAGLLLELIEGHAAAVDAGRGAGLEPVGAEPQAAQRFGEALGGLLAGPAGRHRAVTHSRCAPPERCRW